MILFEQHSDIMIFWFLTNMKKLLSVIAPSFHPCFVLLPIMYFSRWQRKHMGGLKNLKLCFLSEITGSCWLTWSCTVLTKYLLAAGYFPKGHYDECLVRLVGRWPSREEGEPRAVWLSSEEWICNNILHHVWYNGARIKRKCIVTALQLYKLCM